MRLVDNCYQITEIYRFFEYLFVISAREIKFIKQIKII